MGLFDSLPPPSKTPTSTAAEASTRASQEATPAAAAPAGGLFGSLPPPAKPPADAAAGKRPAEASSFAAESAADDSVKRARSDGGELASTGSGLLASSGSGGSLGAAAPRCTRLEAAFSEDSGSRLTMEDVAVVSLDALAGAEGAPAEGAPGGNAARVSFFGVFDGHGGRHVAQYAAEHLNACCLAAGLRQEAARVAAAAAARGAEADAVGGDAAAAQPSVKACKAAVAEGFKELDRRVLERCAADAWPDGCTAVAAWVLAQLVLVANVGDARCVLARRPPPAIAAAPAGDEGQPAAPAAAAAGAEQQQQEQQEQQQQGQQQACLEPLKAVTLTREHKAIFPQERQRIERAGSFVSGDGRLAGRIEVSRAFGDRQFKRAGMTAVPDVQAFTLSRRDRFLLLACDGFWGVFSPQDAVDFAQRELARGHGAKQTCNRLIHEAIRERRCKDNCTVMLVLLDHEAAA